MPDYLLLGPAYTSWEVERWRATGALFDRIFYETALKLEPGMTEQEAAVLLSDALEREGVVPRVLLVGSDERIARYRHPLPSDKAITRTVMLHAAGDYRGQCAAVSRMVTFGPPDETLARDYNLLCHLEAAAFSRLVPGKQYGQLLEERKTLLAAEGRMEEFENHYPGADIGYFLGSSAPLLEDQLIRSTACHDLFVTLTGSKVEELVMAGEGGGEVLSHGSWPVKAYTYGDYRCELPVLLER